MSWTNADGLTVLMHEEQGEVNNQGTSAVSHRKQAVFHIDDATTLGDTDTAAAGPTDAFIPAGAIITDAFLVVDTQFTSGGAAVLDLGFKQAAGTNIDDDGIDAAVAVAGLTADAVVVSDGALVGTRLANDSYFMATYDTAAFTAGAGKVVVEYIKV